LTAGTAYTTLNVGQLPTGVALNDPIYLGTGSSLVQLNASGTSAAGTTAIQAPITPSVNWPVGTQVTDHNWIGNNCGSGSVWISTFGVTSVTLSIIEPGGGNPYTYTLVGLPGASSSQKPPSAVSNQQNTSCNFAAPGSGTYASSLCFVDFTPFNPSLPSSPCQEIIAGVTGTTYTMSFCLSVTGGPVAPATIPTYYNPPNSEAFLGNNGFYTGIPGNPAIYQTCEGGGSSASPPCNGNPTSIATISQIQVLESNGQPATGWQLVTGDAESTDAGESITWTANQDLTVLPNSSTSQYGNACATSLTPPYLPQLTGQGTTTVECAATVSSDKTGTVMLETQATSTAPMNMTITMVGTGLEAFFLGMILPS
jgi:hypothetical protein